MLSSLGPQIHGDDAKFARVEIARGVRKPKLVEPREHLADRDGALAADMLLGVANDFAEHAYAYWRLEIDVDRLGLERGFRKNKSRELIGQGPAPRRNERLLLPYYERKSDFRSQKSPGIRAE